MRRKKRAVGSPLPQCAADPISLCYHIALEALRTGQGWFAAAQLLLDGVFFAAYLANAGYGCMSRDQIQQANDMLRNVVRCGKTTGVWRLDAQEFESIRSVINMHDVQIMTAPAGVLSDAVELLTSFRSSQAHSAN